MANKSNVVRVMFGEKDPLRVNERLYKQISKLLDDLDREPKKVRVRDPDTGKMVWEEEEGITIRERIAALVAIGRIQTIFVGLRREDKDGPRTAGSAVRKYSAAFANAGRGRKAGSGPADTAADDLAADDASGDDDTA